MHLPEPLEHESLPDSPYAQELRRGFPDLRFAPDLEQAFQAFHSKCARSRVRFFQLAIGLLAIAAAVKLTMLDAVPLRDVALGWLGLVVPACLALALASWSRRRYERVYLPAARLLLPVIATVAAFGISLLSRRTALPRSAARQHLHGWGARTRADSCRVAGHRRRLLHD